MFSYLHNGKTHTDTSKAYMKNLGLNDNAIEGILNQKAYEESRELTVVKRSRAYKSESDHLFIEASFDDDESKFDLWREKVSEIKQRYPK